MDYDSLLKGDFPDSCQEWIFVFTFENEKIKDVFETARNC